MEQNSPHTPHAQCTCNRCSKDKAKGCQNPYKCTELAHNIIRRMEIKFNPFTKLRKDRLFLTHCWKEKNQRAIIFQGDEVVFNPSLTAKHNINESICILTNKNKIIEELACAYNIQIQGEFQQPLSPYTLMAYAQIMQNKMQNAEAKYSSVRTSAKPSDQNFWRWTVQPNQRISSPCSSTTTHRPCNPTMLYLRFKIYNKWTH